LGEWGLFAVIGKREQESKASGANTNGTSRGATAATTDGGIDSHVQGRTARSFSTFLGTAASSAGSFTLAAAAAVARLSSKESLGSGEEFLDRVVPFSCYSPRFLVAHLLDVIT
jgi:hypothetical protein